MAFITLNYYSDTLGMQTSVNVLIPQRVEDGRETARNLGESGKYKCLYLLHGYSDNQSNWMRWSNIERYAGKYGIAVVMPFVAKSYYCDMAFGDKYYQFVAKELPKIIQEFFYVSDKREDNAVCGLSMGGYGALKIALREKDSFFAGAGLSSVTDICKRVDYANMRPVFGPDACVHAEDDLFKLASKVQSDPNKPMLFMGCGTEDSLYAENIEFKNYLQDRGYELTFMESAGGHSWDFWDRYIQYVLEWLYS